MSVVNISSLAPPSAVKQSAQHIVDPLNIALGEVFDRIQKTQPVLFAQLVATLHAKLGPELRHIVRVRPDLILVSQGRAQVADEILSVLDNCDAIARQQRARQQTRQP